MTPTPDTTAAAVEAMCERLERTHSVPFVYDGSCAPTRASSVAAHLVYVNPDGPEAAAMLREVARERDEWCDKALRACRDSTNLADIADTAEAEAAALREALSKAHGALAPAVGDVEIVSPIAKPIYRAFGILLDALKETSDGL